MVTDEKLQAAAEEAQRALTDAVSEQTQEPHVFSEEFEEKMGKLLKIHFAEK